VRTVHHLGISQSERIVWLREELGVAYKLKCYERDSHTRLEPSGRPSAASARHRPGHHRWSGGHAESGAIIEYIIGMYGQRRLTVAHNQPNYTDYLFWFHFANGSFMPAQIVGFLVGAPGAEEALWLQLMLEQRVWAWRLVEQRLGATFYFADDEFTAIDIMMGFPLTTMRAFAHVDLQPCPNIRVYRQRIGARPAYWRAMQNACPKLAPMLS
jgi:glutathione S-transferase